MKKLLILSFLSVCLYSCGSTKKTARTSKDIIGKMEPEPTNSETGSDPHKDMPQIGELETWDDELYLVRQQIIDYAKTFEGTRYKFGGTTAKGMDCSGLVYTAFQKENINLPRISKDMAKKGIPISLKEIEVGDLVFFKTNHKNTINHVGLVVETKKGEVKFIHSTTRAGVIISSLDEKYWKNSFVEVRRII